MKQVAEIIGIVERLFVNHSLSRPRTLRGFAALTGRTRVCHSGNMGADPDDIQLNRDTPSDLSTNKKYMEGFGRDE